MFSYLFSELPGLKMRPSIPISSSSFSLIDCTCLCVPPTCTATCTPGIGHPPTLLLSSIVDSPRLASLSDPHTLQTAADCLCCILYVTSAAPSLGERVGCGVKEIRAQMSRPVFARAPWGSLSENAVVSYKPLCPRRKTMGPLNYSNNTRVPSSPAPSPGFEKAGAGPFPPQPILILIDPIGPVALSSPELSGL